MLRNGLEPWHLIVVLVVVVLLFGSKRLPDTARALGKSLRILKSETKALKEDFKEGASGASECQGFGSDFRYAMMFAIWPWAPFYETGPRGATPPSEVGCGLSLSGQRTRRGPPIFLKARQNGVWFKESILGENPSGRHRESRAARR